MRQANDISDLRPSRPDSLEMNAILGKVFPVLDHGHIVVMDYMGNDSSIVQAARTSYQAGTKSISTDKGLINYLYKNRHTTPFEMCELKVHVRMPIFIARQWIRHRTASVNEMSARYSILPDKYYVPKPEHLAAQSKTNRQGRGEVLEGAEAEQAILTIHQLSSAAYAHYETLLNENIKGEVLNERNIGLARELARMILPVNFYTEWVWKIDLKNLLGFLALRADSHAQYEIRAYAEILLDKIVKPWVPYAYDAFIQHQHNATAFSQKETELLCEVAQHAHEADFNWDDLAVRNNLTDKQLTEFKGKISMYGEF